MERYFTELSFKGTRYFGWQVQNGQITVQEVLERTFSLFLRQPIQFTGAGRTDAGVHARYFVAHFDANPLTEDFSGIVYKLNRFLPEDITLYRIWRVPDGAHARFSALSRTYTYTLARVKDPFLTDTALLFTLPLDIGKMNEAASVLLHTSDFTSFSKLHSDVKTNICRVNSAFWETEGDKLVFTITADRFLRNMVRAVTGTLLEVGKGRISVKKFEEIIGRKNRCEAGTSLPSRGLSLSEIRYPSELISRFSGEQESRNQ